MNRNIHITDNLLYENTANGIGGLGVGNDRFNVVANNFCRRNGNSGIHAINGRDNIITGNICIDNSQSELGRYSGISILDSKLTMVSANRSGTEGDNPMQKFGIEEQGNSDLNVTVDNICEGNAIGGIGIAGKATNLIYS